ncbi:hypothetical protein PAMA_017263 [Pampus argenteus]
MRVGRGSLLASQVKKQGIGLYVGSRYLCNIHRHFLKLLSCSNCCRTQFLAQLSLPFSGKPCKVFRTVVTPPLCADMSVVVSAVMNALVVCWQEERLIGTSLPPAIRSSSPAGGRGSPLLFNRSTPEKVSALECESGWSPVRLICVYTATLQCFSSSSLVQISYIYLLTKQ